MVWVGEGGKRVRGWERERQAVSPASSWHTLPTWLQLLARQPHLYMYLLCETE